MVRVGFTFSSLLDTTYAADAISLDTVPSISKLNKPVIEDSKLCVDGFVIDQHADHLKPRTMSSES
jgi:hypothetical protein